MRGVAFVATAVVIAIGACNVLTGVNDFSTPNCEDCERRECATQFQACIAEPACGEFVHCLACSSTTCPPCLPPGDDAGVAAALQACAQTQCTVCASATPPIAHGPVGGPDAATK